MIGEMIGHFEITTRAGRGGMGEVFIAEHTTIKTRVAIKVLHAEVSANTDHVQRFFNEARAVARIQHAGIVKIFDVGSHTNGRAYLIMEYLEGETLADRIKRVGRLSPRQTAEIARQIANVLSATHHAGIIHRDLKPENVFLVRDREIASGERVRLLDFGIAKLSDTLAGTSPTTVGAMGTPAYMAPEQWSDSSRVDWRADVYSLGCIVYKMAAGRPPFTATSIAEACAKHLHETPLPIRSYVPDVPVAIDTLALRLLAKDPARRVSSIAVLEQRFADLATTLPGDLEGAISYDPVDSTQVSPTTLSVAASISSSPPAASAPRSRRMFLALAGSGALALGAIALVALVLGAIAVWRAVGSEDRPAEPAVSGVAASDAGPDARTTPADAPDAAPGGSREHALADWVEAANPFVPSHGASWLAHQVTRREYRRFLEAMRDGDALRYQPVVGWETRPDVADAVRPVAWVTFDRAQMFCHAIGAELPTDDQWTAASEGQWGLDPARTGRLGPLQEWTSTVHSGLVVVRGGHERMAPADRAAAATEPPLMKSSEAQAGPKPEPKVIASETIGFRCVR